MFTVYVTVFNKIGHIVCDIVHVTVVDKIGETVSQSCEKIGDTI